MERRFHTTETVSRPHGWGPRGFLTLSPPFQDSAQPKSAAQACLVPCALKVQQLCIMCHHKLQYGLTTFALLCLPEMFCVMAGEESLSTTEGQREGKACMPSGKTLGEVQSEEWGRLLSALMYPTRRPPFFDCLLIYQLWGGRG